MKWVVFGLLILPAFASADEQADRIAIERLLDALSDYQPAAGQEHVSALFTADADNDLSRLAELDPAEPPWSEVTKPRVALHSLRFITSDVALVDASNTQYGSIVVKRRIPLLLVLKKEARGWRIASLRVLADLRSPR